LCYLSRYFVLFTIMTKDNRKPNILLMPDFPGWAYDNRADKIIEYLSDSFAFTKLYYDDAAALPEQERPAYLDWQRYDCVFPFFWKHFKWLNSYPDMNKALTGVFSFQSWEGQRQELCEEIGKYRALVVNSQELYSKIRGTHPHVFHAPNGVDEKLFQPADQPPGRSGDLTIGWVGNPDYSHNGSYDHKGYYSIFLPAIKRMSGIRLKTALQGKARIPHEQMPGFYRRLDVYVSVSASESSPNPVLEAMASGVPVITTAKGSAHLVQDGYNGLVIERTQADL